LPNVGPYIYDVSISGFTRSSIYIYDISSLRVNPLKQGIFHFYHIIKNQNPPHFATECTYKLRIMLRTNRNDLLEWPYRSDHRNGDIPCFL